MKRRSSDEGGAVAGVVGSNSGGLSPGAEGEELPLAGTVWRPSDGVPLWLGLDPGIRGGIVAGKQVRGGLGAVGAWAWAPVQRQKQRFWLVQSVIDGVERERIAPSLWHVGQLCVADLLDHGEGKAGWVLTVEGLFGQGTTLERLSWYAGLVAGPLHARAVGTVARPYASQWRPAILDIPARMQADEAEQRAILWAGKNCYWLGRLGQIGHVAEAAAIAEWGRREYARSERALSRCQTADGSAPAVSSGEDAGP